MHQTNKHSVVKSGLISDTLNYVYSFSLEKLVVFAFFQIIFFAAIYVGISLLPWQGSSLSGLDLKVRLISGIYYSSSVTSNTGVGELGTINIYKIIASVQMFIGIFLFAFVIAKLTSRKNDEVLKNLYEMEIETNYRNFKEEMFIVRRRLDAILTRSTETSRVSEEDIGLLSMTFLELSIEMALAPKLLLNIGDDSSLDRKRQEVLVQGIARTLARLHKVLSSLNSSNILWASNLNFENLVNLRKDLEKYFFKVEGYIKDFNQKIYAEIMDSKKYLELIENDIEQARLTLGK